MKNLMIRYFFFATLITLVSCGDDDDVPVVVDAGTISGDPSALWSMEYPTW